MDGIFWQGKRVAVTGAAGFVGSHLAQKLTSLGSFVIGIDRAKPGFPIPRLSSLSKEQQARLILENNDLSNAESIKNIFEKHHIDTVMHLAASAIVSEAAKNPNPTISSNVLGTLNVLEACRHLNTRRVLIASSDKTYGDHATDPVEPLPYEENYALKGLDIYSASKTCADMLSQAYAFQYKLPIAILRCCNIYGPGDMNVTRLIPKTILRLLAGKPGQIKLGHEKVLREYIYIDDVVNAYLFLGQRIEDYYGEGGKNMPVKGQKPYGWPAFNVGSYTKEQTKNLSYCKNIKSVSQVLTTLQENITPIEPEIIERAPEYIEIPDEYSDSSKLLQMGFRPEIEFDKGIKQTINWHKQNYELLKKLGV